MKRLRILFLLCISYTNLLAQHIQEGSVEFKITYPGLKGQAKEDLELLPQSMVIYFKPGKFRLELHTIAGTTVLLTHVLKQESYMLMEMMGKKIAMLSTTEENRKLEEENKLKYPSEISLGNTTKKIAGYPCREFRVKAQHDSGTHQFIGYYTDELPDFASTISSTLYKDIKGFMLEYETMTNGLIMHFTAVKITPKSIDDVWFEVPPDYQITKQSN
ncbi:MAG: DUF4412 domain-containing protein [Bacteroidia bacterium]|jgi:hypothetical protein